MLDKFKETHGLYDAKIKKPSLRKEFVRRHRLNSLLNDASKKLFLIHTPAGYGKTSLVSDYLIQHRRKASWLSLDRTDNDLSRFYLNLCFSLNKVQPGLFDDIISVWGKEFKMTHKIMMDVFVSKLGELNEDFSVVLDDFHYINLEEIYLLIEDIINYMPPNVSFIILSRRRIVFRSTSKLKLNNQVEIIDSADLRFSLNESNTFFSNNGIQLSSEEESLMSLKSEGWIAGLQFAVMSLHGTKNISEVIKNIDKSNANIKDYFFHEVFNALREELKDFMINTAFIDRFSPDLCNTVLGINNSHELILDLLKDNLFISKIDDNKYWYRYHHLFRQLLLDNYLLKSNNGEGKELHHKAASWFINNDYLQEGLLLLSRLKDYVAIKRVVKERRLELLMNSQYVSLCNYVELLPDDLIIESPRICQSYAWALVFTGNIGRLIKVLNKAEKTEIEYKGIRKKTIHFFTNGELLALRAVTSQSINEIEQSIEYGMLALEKFSDEEEFLKGLTFFTLGRSYFILGYRRKALHYFDECIKIKRFQDIKTGQYGAFSYKGLIYITQAEYKKAGFAIDYVLKQRETDQVNIPFSCFAYLGKGIIDFEKNRIEDAKSAIIECIRLNKLLGNDEINSSAHFVLSQIYLLQNDRQNYEMVSSQLYDFGLSTQEQRVKLQTKLYLAMLELVDGEHILLSELIEELKDVEADEISAFYIKREFIFARYDIYKADYNNAIKRLLGILPNLKEDNWGEMLFHSLLQISKAYLLLNDYKNASKNLLDALKNTSNDWLVRTILSEKKWVSKVLEILIKDRNLDDSIKLYINFLLTEMGRGHASLQHEVSIPFSYQMDPLTKRELEVIELISKGLKNKEIANELYISVGTVKTHIIKIYSKLDARNRTEAIIKATDLQILG